MVNAVEAEDCETNMLKSISVIWMIIDVIISSLAIPGIQLQEKFRTSMESFELKEKAMSIHRSEHIKDVTGADHEMSLAELMKNSLKQKKPLQVATMLRKMSIKATTPADELPFEDIITRLELATEELAKGAKMKDLLQDGLQQ